MFSSCKKSQNDFLRRVRLGIAGVALALSVTVSAAEKPLVAIKQVQVSENDRVDLLLDGKLDPSQIRTEFLNDIVQLSVSDASVYPAKISSVSGKDLTKIFVYQYAPRLVRVRLTVKGKAENFQSKVQVRPSGKLLTIRLDGGSVSDKVVSSAAQVQKKGASTSSATLEAEAEERALLERVLKSPVAKAAEPRQESPERNTDKNSEKTTAREASSVPEKSRGEANQKSTESGSARRERNRSESSSGLQMGKKEGLSPVRMMLSLVGVIVLLGAALLGLRKLAVSRSSDGAVGRWVRKSLGRSEKMIEVVATHHLGPKKSIHMVKVAGRTLVLGVADDSINLITELQGGTTAPAASATRGSGSDEDFFSALGEQLAQESGRTPSQPLHTGSGATAAGPAIYHPGTAQNRSGARDRIRSRLEGMKQL